MASKQVTKPKRGSPGYPQDVVDKCLITLVSCNGNKQATLRLLKEDGITITDKTLTDWVRRKHADRYQEIREGRAAAQERLLARNMLDVAGHALEAEDLAITKAQERLEANEETDPARAALNLARTKQIAIDKMLTLTGRPQQITESRDVTEVARALVALGVLKPPDQPIPIESTAEEETQ